MKRALAVAVALIVVAAPPPAEAKQGASEFCDGSVVHDFLAPLARMRKLHGPPRSEMLGFGPAGTRIGTLHRLNYEAEEIGIWIQFDRSLPELRPAWTMTTTVVRVDARGRPLEEIGRHRIRIDDLRDIHRYRGIVQVGAGPAFYRATVVIQTASGSRLGHFGAYFRNVRPVGRARLELDATSYRPTDLVLGRVESFGTVSVLYYPEYSIESWNGLSWSPIPETPKDFEYPLQWALAGRVGTDCSEFQIPATVPAGRYRMVKKVFFGAGLRNVNRRLTAEFEVAR
jgi:hypothetical protein